MKNALKTTVILVLVVISQLFAYDITVKKPIDQKYSIDTLKLVNMVDEKGDILKLSGFRTEIFFTEKADIYILAKLNKTRYFVEFVLIKVDDNGVSILEEGYHPKTDEFILYRENKLGKTAEIETNFLFDTSLDPDFDPEAVNTTNAVSGYAEDQQYIVTKLIGSGATIENIQNNITKPSLIGMGNIGHGNTEGIELYNGLLDYTWFREQDLAGKVFFFNSCYVHNNPLEGAIMDQGYGNARMFIGGEEELPIIYSECVYQDWWDYTLNDGTEMRDAYNAVQLEYSCIGAYGFSGDEGIMLLTTSGELKGNEIWSGTIALTGNVIVPYGKILTINPGCTVDIRDGVVGYYLLAEEGGTIVNNGTITPVLDIEVRESDGSPVNGYFGSIEVALDYASSGQTVYINSGQYSIFTNTEITGGATLRLERGTSISGYDHQISVYGTLKIVGTADARVSIMDTYIYGGNGSTVEIDYTDIEDSYSYGLYVSSGTAKINNSTFSNNNYSGIYLYYPQSGSEIENCTLTGNSFGGVRIFSGSPLDIKNCTFTGNSSFGLYLGSVNIPNDRIADNWFEGNQDGIRFYSGGNANLTTTRIDPWDHQGNPGEAYLNNIFKDNDRYGAYIKNSATPMLGSYTFIGGDESGYYWYGGFNAFVNAGSTCYIKSENPNAIDIRLNFWDVESEEVLDQVEGTFIESENSNLYINPGSLSKSTGVDISSIDNNEKHQLSPLEVQLLEGDSLLITNHLDQAFEVYERIINNSPDANEARVALNRIIYIYWNQEKQNDLISWLNGIHVKYPKKLIGTIAYDYTTPLLVMKGDIDMAISRNDEVVNSYDRLNEPEYAAEALYENMIIYENMAMESSGSGRVPKLHAADASSKMSDYISRILSKYPETSTAELLREEYHHELPEPISTIIPTKYELHACYPNPFNPLTNIVFEIPEETKVSLVIYDLAGRTVWEKPNNDEIMSSGQYSYQWDGRNVNNVQVATGIYFIRLKTPRHIQTRKVVFIK